MTSSRAISAVLCIIVCLSANFWNVKAIPVSLTPDTSSTVISTEYFPPNTTNGTIFQPTKNSTVVLNSSNEINTTLTSPNMSLATTPISFSDSQTSVTISGPSTVTITTTSIPSVSVPETGQTGNTVNNTFKTISTKDNTENYNNVTSPMETTTNILAGKNSYSLTYSETVLTSIFGTALALVILTILTFTFKKYIRRRSQYSHHPLRESSFESVDRYSPPDDTLVISGGLYDAPRIYNPNMTVLEEEDSQTDYVTFNSRQGQFRLEFLPDKNMDPSCNSSLRNF